MNVEAVREALQELQSPPKQTTATHAVVPLAFTWHLNVAVTQQCPSCGHRMSNPRATIDVVKGFGYPLDVQRKKKTRVPIEKYEIDKGETVEL